MGAIYLIRHGQASFGHDDYDRLSPLGRAQSARLGEALRAIGLVPDAIVRGSMRRHAETAGACLPAMGVEAAPRVDPDEPVEPRLGLLQGRKTVLLAKVPQKTHDQPPCDAMAALAILAVVSGREASRAWRRGRRIGPGAVALLWVLSSLGAVVALHWLPR